MRPSSGPGSYGASVLPFVENLQNLVQMEDALPPLGDYTSPHARTLRRCQGYRNGLRSLMRVDRFIGDAFDLLRRKGEMDNTYFVFYTDNGTHFGQHRFEHGKLQPYEEDVNFPLYVRGPGIPRGVVKPELIGNHDIAPTLADMAGADVPNFVDGRSCPSFLRKLIRRPQVFAPASCCGHLCVRRSIRSAARGWRRRGGSLPELAARELGYGRFDQPIEVRVGDAHRVDVGAGPEDYRFVFRQRLFHVDRQIVEVAEGRHCADLAVGEGPLEFLLLGEANLPRTQRRARFLHVYLVRSRQRQHDHLAIGQDHDSFGQHLSRNVLACSYLLGGDRPGVVPNLERNLLLSQVGL